MCLCVAAYTYHEETLLLKSSAPLCCFTFLLITLWVRIRQRGSRLTDKGEPRVSLWCAYDITQYREQLEKKSNDEQHETVHCERKRSIGRWLTPSPALRRPEFGAQD